jgi:hydroxymethylpyrimidine pyrophosphatase-like HAD family hydrolase
MNNPPVEELGSLLSADGRPIIVLSDFDGTLCFEYNHNPNTVDREPIISDKVILASRGISLVMATARRLDHPNATKPWEVGLVDRGHPIILENGGVIATLVDGAIAGEVAVDNPEQLGLIHGFGDMLKDAIECPDETQLIAKLGRTMTVLILRDDRGRQLPKQQSNEKHAWLAGILDNFPEVSGFNIANSNDSVAIQPLGISKASAFKRLLGEFGLDRGEMCVVGMGDGENDIPIFHEADIAISFSDSEKVKNQANVQMHGDHLSAAQALCVIQEFSKKNGVVPI